MAHIFDSLTSFTRRSNGCCAIAVAVSDVVDVCLTGSRTISDLFMSDIACMRGP